ncbi:MAG: GNAT family N-acetyltransferase [Chloroflexota bacterium]|nr:MAG: GNAT family N-acetyltransferase [Chloroflexota bacterium]
MPLEGELVILREEHPEDMVRLAALRNDLETQAWSKSLPPDYTENMYMKRFQGREFSYDPKEGRFIIISRETGEFAGSISYTGLHPRWAATIGLMVDKKFWGTGFAAEAQELLLKFLFTELGLRVVRLFTHSGNPRAVGLAKKAGFQIGIRQRQAIFKNGELYDNLSMDLLREEYFARHPQLVDNLPSLA